MKKITSILTIIMLTLTISGCQAPDDSQDEYIYLLQTLSLN